MKNEIEKLKKDVWLLKFNTWTLWAVLIAQSTIAFLIK